MYKICQMNWIKNISFFVGPYGCGKTVVGSEAVKIKDAKLKDMNLDVEKHILTFDCGMNYDRLNQDLKNKWLKGYNENDQLKMITLLIC